MERRALQQGWGALRSQMWPTGDSGVGIEGRSVLGVVVVWWLGLEETSLHRLELCFVLRQEKIKPGG